MANSKNKKANNKKTLNSKNKVNSYKKTNSKKNNLKKTTSNKTTNNKTIKKSNKNIKTKAKLEINSLQNNKEYKEAEKLYKNKNYDEAYKIYLKLLEENKDKKIYKRLIECLTKDFSYKDSSKEFNKIYNDYLTTYKILITKKELNILEKKLEEYKNIKPIRSKSKFVLIFLFGFLGIHKFLEKKYIWGLIYLFTFGFFGIGIIYDLINDYVEYENDLGVDIVRYIISIILIIFALLNINNLNFYYLIIASVIFMPIVYSKILYLIPGIIKVIVIVMLIILSFNKKVIIDSVPLNIVGTWETTNENTNFVSVKVKNDKTIIKFNDRKSETGLNEYNSDTKVLKVNINATTYYKFILDKDGKHLCIYNDSKTCNVAFSKNK